MRVLRERGSKRDRDREGKRDRERGRWGVGKGVQQVSDARCDAKSFPRAFSREIDLKFINIQRRVWKITR